MKPRNVLTGLVAAHLFAFGAASHADVFVKEVSLGAGQATGSLFLPVQAPAANYWAGIQNIKVNTVASDAGANSFLAYCIDPAHWSSGSYQVYYDPVPITTVSSIFSAQAGNLQKLFDKYYAGTISNNANAAAFQLALWEIANDDQNTGTGAVRANGAATNATVLANANAILGSYASYAGPHLFNLSFYQVHRDAPVNAVGQSYVVATPVPEPTTVAMVLAGLGMLGFVGRKGVRGV
jgi:hypothetical protein